jgi:autotransporter-associated beta strand protein
LSVGDITGSGSLTKAGSGTLKLTGSNSYEGVTVVQGRHGLFDEKMIT